MPSSQASGVSAETASELARQLFSRETRGASTDDAAIAAAERICAMTLDGLSRWFGPYGSHALFMRALASAQTRDPRLSGVTMDEQAGVAGIGEAVRVHGAPAMAEGVVATMGALAELIGRLIGDDLAIQLLEQSTMTSSGSERAALDATAPDDAPKPVKHHE